MTINLNNLNEAPVVNDQSFSVNENAANGTVVGTVVASDPDAGDTLGYAITAGNTGGAFAINASTGEITVNNQRCSELRDDSDLQPDGASDRCRYARVDRHGHSHDQPQ